MIRKIPLKMKKKTCVVCGDETFIFSKGRCKFCTAQATPRPEAKYTTFKSKPKPKNKRLETYFEKQIEKLLKLRESEESGAVIAFPTKANICHLFPKRNHKSVQDHEENCIFLTWDEHNTLDSKYLDRLDFKGLKTSFPNSYLLMIERMKIVRLSITERTNCVEAFDKFIEELEN